MINPFSLNGKNILVTGASSGIGKQIALSAAQMGAAIHITGRDEARLNGTLEALTGAGHSSKIADLTIEEHLDQLVANSPKLDGLVLSSGIVKTLPFKFVTNTELDTIMQANFYAPVMLLNKLVRNKKLNKNSSVVFISSIGGNFIGTKGNSMYSAAKGAINAMQKVIALELVAQKIRVNNVSPGMVKTELIGKATAFTDEQFMADEKNYPLGYGEPADVANAVIYLLSDASKWVTGISLLLDGGFTLQ
ncbi:SDR family oxidoreductase [Mucilaginibacter pallidiroseus]|uniref:SDR family oxidoreductase n=1 Tax=Mucilaginibacter pallidiroseus TaxID=2599295 RepID=A0A563U0L2_9SPHI|nr:SDR family oxidoreductase [Mucilaginibacter pallidiroseus]TWR25175.1 SDR family oxidoreductase [Mucilaginibacter pallidiroseus]